MEIKRTSRPAVPDTKSDIQPAESSPALEWMIPALHGIIGAEMTAGFCFRQQNGRLAVRAARSVNVPVIANLTHRCEALMQSVCDNLEAAPDTPAQLRNKVLVYPCDAPSNDDPLLTARLLLPFGPGRERHQICLTICNESMPLAWIGGWQLQRFDINQQRLLSSLIAPLRRCLLDERAGNRPSIDPEAAHQRQDPRTTLVGTATARWRLTPRQQSVLDLLARGLTNALIADELSISLRTVEFHATAIFDKAGVDNRTALLARLLL